MSPAVDRPLFDHVQVPPRDPDREAVAMSRLGVVVVDDHPTFAEALGHRLAAEPDIEVLAIAYDARSAMATVATLHPDLVTLDVRLGEEDGIALCARMRNRLPGLPVVAVTAVEDPVRAAEGVRAGVRAWVLKDIMMPMLLAVIRGAAKGESYFPPALLGRMLPLLVTGAQRTVTDHRLARLTERELEVLQCMVDGHDRRSTAAALFVSVNTVRTHTQSLMSKLNVHSSLEAVAVALSAGLRTRTASDPPSPPVVRPGEQTRAAVTEARVSARSAVSLGYRASSLSARRAGPGKGAER